MQTVVCFLFSVSSSSSLSPSLSVEILWKGDPVYAHYSSIKGISFFGNGFVTTSTDQFLKFWEFEESLFGSIANNLLQKEETDKKGGRDKTSTSKYIRLSSFCGMDVADPSALSLLPLPPSLGLERKCIVAVGGSGLQGHILEDEKKR